MGVLRRYGNSDSGRDGTYTIHTRRYPRNHTYTDRVSVNGRSSNGTSQHKLKTKRYREGIQHESLWLSLLIWADNLYLFARTLPMLQLMCRETTTAIEKTRFYWKPESLEYITSVPPEVELPEWELRMMEVGATEPDMYPCIRRGQLKILGPDIRWDGCPWATLQGRLNIAQGVFWSKIHLWKGTAARNRKLAAWVRFIHPLVLHGSRVFRLSQSVLKYVGGGKQAH